jgi:hypothetical protein
MGESPLFNLSLGAFQRFLLVDSTYHYRVNSTLFNRLRILFLKNTTLIEKSNSNIYVALVK